MFQSMPESVKWVAILVVIACVPGLSRTPESTSREVEQRIKNILEDIRKRAKEAETEIGKVRQEAKQITKEAEERSRKIQAESDAYVRKIEREIEEIQKRMPSDDGVTKRNSMMEPLSDTLSQLSQPLSSCFAHPTPENTEACLIDRFRQAIFPLIRSKFSAYESSSCVVQCKVSRH